MIVATSVTVRALSDNKVSARSSFCGVSRRGRPPLRPFAAAAAIPVCVRSRVTSISKSQSASSQRVVPDRVTCCVVSSLSSTLRKPIPRCSRLVTVETSTAFPRNDSYHARASIL
jgi:hypothetical protein